jgi:hypothetical protein
MQRTGKLSVLASADPLSKLPTFAGSARLSGLSLPELGEFLSSKAGVTPDQGSIDMSARFESKDGHITGGLKPVVKNAGLQPAKPGLFDKLKAAVADAALHLFSDRVPGRNAVATTIPIQGEITQPNTQAWPVILSILRNAFVEGLRNGFSNLPPHSAEDAAR